MLRRRNIPWIVLAAALSSVLAGVVHLWVAPQHFEEWWGYGAFFLVAGGLQLLFAVALVGWPRRIPPFPRRWILVGGIAVNLGLIAFYLFTRTVGVPAGPEAGEIEKVQSSDLIAKAAEAVLVVLLIFVGIVRYRMRRQDRVEAFAASRPDPYNPD